MWWYRFWGIKRYRLCYQTIGPVSNVAHTFKMESHHNKSHAEWIKAIMAIKYPNDLWWIEEVE